MVFVVIGVILAAAAALMTVYYDGDALSSENTRAEAAEIPAIRPISTPLCRSMRRRRTNARNPDRSRIWCLSTWLRAVCTAITRQSASLGPDGAAIAVSSSATLPSAGVGCFYAMNRGRDRRCARRPRRARRNWPQPSTISSSSIVSPRSTDSISMSQAAVVSGPSRSISWPTAFSTT